MYLHKPYKKSGDYKYRDLYFFNIYPDCNLCVRSWGKKKSLDPQVSPDATRTCCLRWWPQSGWLVETRKEMTSHCSQAFALFFFQNLQANLNNHRKGDQNILGYKSQLTSFHKIFKVHSYSTLKGNTEERSFTKLYQRLTSATGLA